MALPDRISLKQRVLNAGAWSLAGFAVIQVVRFGSNLVMTRLLVPEMFGVMAVAGMIMMCLAMFSDMGLPQSVIQNKRGNEPIFLNTIWVTQIVRGFILWLGALLAALSVGLAGGLGFFPSDSAYANPILPYVIAALSFSVIVSGFQSTKLFEAGRNLSIGRVTRNSIVAQVAGVICMIIWALVDRSIWALVAGSICTTVVAATLSHALLPGVRNRWEWDRSAFGELFHFGKWMFLSSILGFLAISGDRLLLGGMISGTLLGIYVIAFLIFSAVDQVMTKVITDVSFPAFSELARERRGDLKAGYYRVYSLAAPFAYFCAGVLMISGQTVIGILYDHRYDQAGWMLQILSVALATIPIRVAGACFLALGLAKLYSYLVAIRAITLFLLVPLLFHFFGLPGAIWGVVASYFSSMPVTVYFMIKHGLFDWRRELLLLPALFVGMLLAKAATLLLGYS